MERTSCRSQPHLTRRARRWGLSCLAVLLTACGEPDAVGPEPDPPGPNDAVLAQQAVEGLVGEAMAGWWRAAHGSKPGPALSTAADAHTSSWQNWGMLEAGAEPRQPLNLDPSDRRNFTVEPWMELYRTLAAVRQAMGAIDNGVDVGSDAETRRTVAVGRFLQGITLGTLAQLYERAWILDEDTDLASAELASYAEVHDAALARLAEAVALAESGGFTVPAAWVGFHEDLTSTDLARLARSFRARLASSVARTPAERAAVDWSQVLADAEAGVTRAWGGFWNGDAENNWAWAMEKLWAGTLPAWARMDYRTIGPADASGAWQDWIAREPHARRPFTIHTADRRIADQTGTAAGLYMEYLPTTQFRPERGRDHFSHYSDTRWDHLVENEGVGFYPDMTVDELRFLRAESHYRLGDRAAAMALVNEFRARGSLPPFTGVDAAAPGGDLCVPRRTDGACGDLWEALKYEKRIELYHTGPFVEYLDDRGWGDLVPGTFTQFPPVSGDLTALVSEILGGLAPANLDVTSGEGLATLRQAFDAYDRSRNQHPGQVAGS